MGERASYSRVYWEIVDDPKFALIYDHDAHLAAWLRLLLIADQAHPASAHLPSSVRRSSIKALSEAELIDLLPGSRYRIHGLDAERQRRKDAATSRPPLGPTRGPNGHHSGTERSPLVSDTRGLRRDETSQDEPNARESLPGDDGRADLEAFLLITRRPPTERQRKLLDGVLRLHDLTGPQWAAQIMLAHPDDPIGAVIEADKAYRRDRIEEARSQEITKIVPHRSKARGLTGVNAELAALMRDLDEKRGTPA
jgi:hypothetical protein